MDQSNPTEVPVSSAAESPNIRRAAWLVWIFLAISICLVVQFGKDRSATGSYRTAVESWFSGEPLYNMEGTGFIYLPQAAIVYAPWGFAPKPLGELLWRLAMLGILAAGVFRWTRFSTSDDRWFLITSIVAAAMAAGCARSGQSTLMITGLMILAATDLGEKRWWRATVFLILAMAFKPLAIVLLLIAAAVYYRPMIWRLAIGMIALAALPFLTQSPGYVISQYEAAYQNFVIAFSLGETGMWAQFFGMLKVAGLDLSSNIQQVIRLIFAMGALIGCWQAARKLSPERCVFYLFALSACYLMLFNSRTEGSTYAMVGPVYGFLLAQTWLQYRDKIATIGFLSAIVATTFSFELALLVTPRPNHVWLSPFVCVIMTAVIVRHLIGELGSLTPAPDTAEL